MIERKFVAQKIKEFQIGEFIANSLGGAGYSGTKLQRTPLGEKIIVSTSRPGLIVGRKGQNIKQLTMDLKTKFKLENPQIEINEVEKVYLDANIVSGIIASNLERFGTARFKGIAHKTMENVMRAGAIGVEILISGTVPSQRAKTWRFWQGYLKKCGEVAIEGVNKAYAIAKIKRGIVGVQVKIMPPDIRLPDDIRILSDIKTEEEVKPTTENEVIREMKSAEEDDIKKAKKNTKEKSAEEDEVIEEKSESKEEKKAEINEKDEEPIKEKKETKTKEEIKDE